MKVYSIGREQSCDIVIEDNTDIISRRHLLLNVYPSGKMTIIDQSQNGTYVNGMRIASRVPVPVTRKDNVSLAHVARLDWSRVPKPVPVMRYAIIGIVALAVIAAAVFGYMYITRGGGGSPVINPSNNEEQLFDSIHSELELKAGEEASEAEPAESKSEPKGEIKKQAVKKEEKSRSPQASESSQQASQSSQQSDKGASQEKSSESGGNEAVKEAGSEALPSDKSDGQKAAEKTDTVKRATRLGFN